MNIECGSASLDTLILVDQIKKFGLEKYAVLTGRLADEWLGYNHMIGIDSGFNRIAKDSPYVEAYSDRKPTQEIWGCYGAHVTTEDEVCYNEEFNNSAHRCRFITDMDANIVGSIKEMFKGLGYKEIIITEKDGIYCVDEISTDLARCIINRLNYLEQIFCKITDCNKFGRQQYITYATELNNLVDILIRYRFEHGSFAKLKLNITSYGGDSPLLDALFKDVNKLVTYIEKHNSVSTRDGYKEVNLHIKMEIENYRIVARTTNMQTGKPVKICIDTLDDFSKKLWQSGMDLSNVYVKLYGTYIEGEKEDTLIPKSHKSGTSYTFLVETMELLRRQWKRQEDEDGYTIAEMDDELWEKCRKLADRVDSNCRYWIEK